MKKTAWWLFYLLFISVFLTSCWRGNPFEYKLTNLDGDGTSLGELLGDDEGLVLVYLSPECPLCKNYGPTLAEHVSNPDNNALKFVGIVSGSFYPSSQIRAYLQDYDLDMEVLLDPKFKLARTYNATTTPEVHVVDRDGALRYSGAIDNWAISLGKKRLEPTEFYLSDAIKNYLADQPIDPRKTTPVGCFIE